MRKKGVFILTGLEKKRLLVLVAIICAAVLLLLAAIPLIDLLLREPAPTYDFEFADPSLSADIYADKDYMGLDRSIYYTTSRGSYDFKTAIEEDSYTSYNKAVQLLIQLVFAAQAGDADAYNACFSPEYIAKEGRFGSFTMQKVYDINIREYTSSASITVPNVYDEVYFYGLSYKIKDNNGSLRKDMDSDSSCEQYMTVVIDKQDRAWIYGVQTVHYKPAS